MSGIQQTASEYQSLWVCNSKRALSKVAPYLREQLASGDWQIEVLQKPTSFLAHWWTAQQQYSLPALPAELLETLSGLHQDVLLCFPFLVSVNGNKYLASQTVSTSLLPENLGCTRESSEKEQMIKWDLEPDHSHTGQTGQTGIRTPSVEHR